MSTQAMTALAHAQEIRLARVALCRQIHSQADAAEIVRTSEIGLPVRKALRAITGWGDRRVEAVMDECAISYWSTLGGERRDGYIPITDRQREVLAAYLERR